MAVEQTRGYFNVKGQIFGLEGKEPYENDFKRVLQFRVKTSKENQIPVEVGGLLSRGSSFKVKVKCEGMDKAVEIPEQEAIDEIRAIFKDGDEVFLNLSSEVDTYRGELKYNINQIYILSDKLDFESEDFKETNSLRLPVVITEKINKNKQKCVVANYKNETLDLELISSNDVITDFLQTKVNPGDVVPVMIQVHKEIIREEVLEEDNKEEVQSDNERKTLMGNIVGSQSKKYKKQGKIIGSKNVFTIIDIDDSKIEYNKYIPSDYLKETQSDDMPY